MSRTLSFLLNILFLGSSLLLSSQTAEAPKVKEPNKITEVVTTDSLPASELLKRAVNFVKTENPKYTKTNGVTAGSKAECNITFPVKPKELNPVCDYTGKIMMKVIIECKDSKYKYIIENIRHVSTGGKTSIGNIDNIIAECGSMIMPDLTLKKLRGEAYKYAGSVANDIKTAMKNAVDNSKGDW
ncbi:MAG: hypothetical protein H0W61_15440 [Bacteroidetes bacterium]|nr:hypothetical protein [Bacteroidota bacterium]